MEKLILIKFGELSTKGDNRKQFIKQLISNIKNLIKTDFEIIQKHDRLYLKGDISLLKKGLSYIFGIQGYAEAVHVENDLEKIKAALLKLEPAQTFKIITKRANKNFPYSSTEMNNLLGAYLLEKTKMTVDVHNPELKITVEIRNEGTFIYPKEEKGLGGYPVSIQGNAVLMLSGGLDSPVAGYLAMKRGINLICLYFDSPPHTSEGARQKVIELGQVLNKYSGNLKLLIVPLTEIQEQIYKTIPLDYNITILRRMMYRISSQIERIIINGESIGQVASQTIDSIYVINQVTNQPVIRPLACFDKLEIIELAKKINTYEISIRPYLDCCTVFLAKHPVIKPKLEKCLHYETLFDYQSLIEKAIKNIEEIDLNERNEWL